MNMIAKETPAERRNVTNRWFGNYPAIIEATHQRLTTATDFYASLFRKYHPIAAAPEPTRGWTWVDEEKHASMEKRA